MVIEDDSPTRQPKERLPPWKQERWTAWPPGEKQNRGAG